MKRNILRLLIIFTLFGLTACTDPTPSNEVPSNNVYSIENIFDIPLHTEVPDHLPVHNHAFIVLGSALSEDGEIKETLLNRLKVVLEAAKKYPHSKIIVSGGGEKNGVTEADVMYDWLVNMGIEKERIIKEASSSDTIDNAIFSLQIATENNIKDLTIITSASHIRRALLIFDKINEANSERIEKPFSHIVHMDFDSDKEARNVSIKEKLLIYRDLIRASRK